MRLRPLSHGGCPKHGPRTFSVSRRAAQHDLMLHELLVSVHLNEHPSRLREGHSFTTYGDELNITSVCERGRIRSYIYAPGER
jgi:hypothetical protein